jgi:hypothetical protein
VDAVHPPHPREIARKLRFLRESPTRGLVLPWANSKKTAFSEKFDERFLNLR